ncbi:hypothetical protein [Streptomyces sp. NPDC002990]
MTVGAVDGMALVAVARWTPGATGPGVGAGAEGVVRVGTVRSGVLARWTTGATGPGVGAAAEGVLPIGTVRSGVLARWTAGATAAGSVREGGFTEAGGMPVAAGRGGPDSANPATGAGGAGAAAGE